MAKAEPGAVAVPVPDAGASASRAASASLPSSRFSASSTSLIAVAFSGGADSTALLFAAAAALPGRVVALHVHHGLQQAADGFELHCRRQCEALGVQLYVAHVDARHASGDSPEDAARRARYGALADLAREAGVQDVLLAQHADDQVETLLLALSRGAGLPGLSGMSARFERHGVRFHRPVLGVSAQAIRKWLADAGVAWVEDPTNADTSFTRNRIRAGILPALEAAFPTFRETFTRSSRHAAEAQRLLDAFADEDLLALGEGDGSLQLARLRQLPRERQANALRRWLATRHGAAASTAQLKELQAQIAACSTRGHRIDMKVGAGFVRREGGVLAWYNSAVLPEGE